MVTKKDSCVKGYGHGKTNWCVSATGRGNLFNEYGKYGKKFFTIHHKDPKTGKENVYGAHEDEGGVIRDKNNDDVMDKVHPDVWKAMSKTPELSNINLMSKNPHTTPEHITKALDHEDVNVRYSAIQHPNVTPEHITKALDDEVLEVRQAAKEALIALNKKGK